MILTVAVEGYRSLRRLVLPLDRLTVVTGANGVGKSGLYRALRLLGDVAEGRVVAALAEEGGLGSTLWAGPETISRRMTRGEVPVEGAVRRERVALKLGVAFDDFGYAIDLGLPVAARGSLFNRDPEIKAEAVWAGPVLRPANTLARRTGPSVTVLRGRERHVAIGDLPPFETMMTHAADPEGAPEVLAVRERLRAVRFYDHLRTDRAAPSRHPRIGTRTTALAGDGGDLAAAIQTIREIGDADALDRAVDAAFPGAAVAVEERDGLFHLSMRQPGLLRPLGPAELSDGTLRYLLLLAALLTPRPPPLLVFNEPETSLHPDLIAPLAALIGEAASRSQVVVVSHAASLVDRLVEEGAEAVHLTRPLGETLAEGVEPPTWSWPSRR
ncbi:AAA family ATPase [Acuticoccus mangrovi]|uniref:AAA family ATPase n=1 Tax=Acuticoccus mangrovi TaxID=2796142 RepID=A0A934INX2_9HYPH|nr:AAA family ATPase [Acuticoccus mangrovi]MBJ3775365.1 AAA family ATPase [Acuticoccus mangrovi]